MDEKITRIVDAIEAEIERQKEIAANAGGDQEYTYRQASGAVRGLRLALDIIHDDGARRVNIRD